MACREIFAKNLRALLHQYGITSVQLAKAIGVDPSLVSRWRKQGCSNRNVNEYALAVASYIAKRNHSAENAAWLQAQLASVPLPSTAADTARLMLWLYPEADVASLLSEEDQFTNLLVVSSFHQAVQHMPASAAAPFAGEVSAGIGTDEIISVLRAELATVGSGQTIMIYLSSEAAAFAVQRPFVTAVQEAVLTKKLVVRMLVQSANNSAASGRLVSAYMQLLVSGSLQFNIIQGTPQTFTTAVHLMLPGRAALCITEATQKNSRPVLVVIREQAVIGDMLENFEHSLRFARPMMTAYDDSFARSIIETFFEEYGVPGSLDVIKCGLNPMFMTVDQYCKVVRDFGHQEEQYEWRRVEFGRFKDAMDQVLLDSRFREVLSLPKLREIARTGRCKMPAMYFMDSGVWHLEAEDCAALIGGYIRYLERVPNFHVILLEDESQFMPNSCWHIKNNKHVMIHSWNVDEPLMIYSDQMMLIDEFQKHFDYLWGKNSGGGSSKRAAIETLREIQAQCLRHLGRTAPDAEPALT